MSTQTIPKTMKAVVIDGNGWFKLNHQHKVPQVSDEQILIKVHAVALNPNDVNVATVQIKEQDIVSGSDVSGTVVVAGKNVTNVVVGDKVATGLGGSWTGEGCFSEYTLQDSSLVWKVPGNISWEEAANLGGVGPHTAFHALYLRLHLAMPSKPSPTPQPIIIWAGSTSVGMFAVQLARLSGYLPITTASPKHYDYLKTLGAEDVYDYRDPTVPEKIKQKFPGINAGLDCFADKESTKLASRAMDKGKLITLRPVMKEGEGWNENVEVAFALLYDAFGKPYRSFTQPGAIEPGKPEERTLLEEWIGKVQPKLVESGKLKANPLRKGAGLETIEDGLLYIKDGKVSGEKLVYAI